MHSEEINTEAIFIAKYYRAGTLGSFGMALFELIQKADEFEKAKLAIIYPEYVIAYKIWFNGDDISGPIPIIQRIKCDAIVEYPGEENDDN